MWLIYYVDYVGFKVYYFEVSFIINIDSIKSFLYIVLCKNKNKWLHSSTQCRPCEMQGPMLFSVKPAVCCVYSRE